MTSLANGRRRNRVQVPKSEMEIFTKHFKETYVRDRAEDGKYVGVITGARVMNHNKIPKLFVDVEFKDNFNNLIKKAWITEFRGDNFRVVFLFDSFEINYENVRVINLDPLVQREAEITIKNNKNYCNITSIIPLEDSVSEEDIEVEMDIDEDFEEEFNEEFECNDDDIDLY